MESVDNRTILIGDVLEKIKEIPDESIDTVISSPPYWGLRDYGVDDQWGLEPSFRQYLDKLNELMEQIRRVLKNTGTVWINLGDTYASSGGPTRHIGYGDPKYAGKNIVNHEEPQSFNQGITPKSRIGVPERFYVRCIDEGWVARNHIPWIKLNSMPSSVQDRFKNMWESVFFFAKKQHYYFDLDAVREETVTQYKPFNRRIRDAKKLRQMGLDGAILMAKASDEEIENYDNKKQDNTLDGTGKPNPTYKGFNDRWKERGNQQPEGRSHFGTGGDIGQHMAEAEEKRKHDVPGQPMQSIKKNREEGKADFESRKWASVDGQTTQTVSKINSGGYNMETGESLNNPKGKNPGDIFVINPKPFPEAHFATFPVELPERIIMCACPQDGIVLDPFFGAGTVGLAAENLGRKWIGIELNPKYVELARRRLDKYKNEGIDDYF